MVAVVSGSSLGLFDSSRNILGGQGAVGDGATGRAGEQVYVNSSTGNLVIQRRDEYLTNVASIFRSCERTTRKGFSTTTTATTGA